MIENKLVNSLQQGFTTFLSGIITFFVAVQSLSEYTFRQEPIVFVDCLVTFSFGQEKWNSIYISYY